MDVPKNGFQWLANEDFRGPCDKVSDTAWTRFVSKQFILYVYADGPVGSGRFWNVSVGFSTREEAKPKRGFCFVTSTIGWRTLQEFDQVPLRWLSDENADNKPELIIWDSFPLSDEPSMAEYGLVAWVYQIDRTGKCKIDWDLSRKKASEIATSYRKPLANNGSTLDFLRGIAAAALEDFASGKCGPDIEQRR
jgi:hypothetical protein